MIEENTNPEIPINAYYIDLMNQYSEIREKFLNEERVKIESLDESTLYNSFISILEKSGGKSESIKKFCFRKELSGIVKDVVASWNASRYGGICEALTPYQLGSGQSGIVIHVYDKSRKNIVYKLGKHLNEEYIFLQKINDYYTNRQHFPQLIIDLCIKDNQDNIIAIAMDNISMHNSYHSYNNFFGYGLYPDEDKLREDYVKYFVGNTLIRLMELRKLGIMHHRDINPTNVLSDYYGNVCLVDFEYATWNNDESFIEYNLDGSRHNVRFNGPNDLSSVGQIGYFLTTGTSIFAKSYPKKFDLSDVYEEIYIERKKVYEDKTGVLMDLTKQKVDCTIEDTKLSYIIKELLTAKPNDHEKIMRMIR